MPKRHCQASLIDGFYPRKYGEDARPAAIAWPRGFPQRVIPDMRGQLHH